MKALILTLGLSLVAALLPPASSEQSLDLSGTWYLKAIVMDRDIPELKVEAAAPLILEPLDGYRKINAKYTILVQGQCHTLKTVLKKVPGPGEYVSKKYKSLLRFKPLPVKDHYVVYCDSEVQGQVVHEAKLIGRDKSKSQESLEAFKNEVSANGSNPENIIFPRQIAACPEDEQ